MPKKDVKKQQKKLAIALVKKRQKSKPAIGGLINNSFHHVKDKQMRSELTDKEKRAKKEHQKHIRKGRIKAEGEGKDEEELEMMG